LFSPALVINSSSFFKTIYPDVINFYCYCRLVDENTLDLLNAHFMMLWNKIYYSSWPPRQNLRSYLPIANNCDFYKHFAVPDRILLGFRQFSPKDYPLESFRAGLLGMSI
jgi:hypothetical protein